MAQKPPHIQALQEEFLACRKLFTALGDETRQELLCALLAGPCQGSRGVELAEKIHLSRPAVSHHLQILKEAGIVRARREGTYIYYYLNPQDGEIQRVLRLFQSIQQAMASAPDRERGTITHCRKEGEAPWNCGKPWNSGTRSGPIRTGPLPGQ